MSERSPKSRLSLLQAAFVIARRDFTAVLFSRVFVFFLLGPLFPLLVGALAGSVGSVIDESSGEPEIGIAMSATDTDAMIAAHGALKPVLGGGLPNLRVLERLSQGETYDALSALSGHQGNLAGVITGTPERPTLTAPAGRIGRLKGDVALLAATALGNATAVFPEVATAEAATSGAGEKRARLATAQAGQLLLFLLIMLLAGMVLSNLVEEKANKVIEILAAAIPMDAVFLGKLFAMLGVSLVGITVWGSAVGAVFALSGGSLGSFADPSSLPDPGVGWPVFLALAIAYFATGYLLLGSIFLAIGSLATTVREVQTLSMPVTMAQVLLFFFASYAMTQPGEPVELAAIAFPLSSPFAMLARAAQEEAVLPHLAALAWQALWVAVAIRVGAGLFRRRVMKSGPPAARRRGLRALFRNGSAREA
jgi:ABC-2 type transport system permease protein